MFLRHRQDARHVRALAVEVDRHDGLGAGRHRLGDGSRVQGKGARIDVDHDGGQAQRWMTSTVEMNVKGVMTSSPGFRSKAIKAAWSASVPLAHGTT